MTTPRSRGRHAFVTGGGGFIGSRLVARLLAEGYRVALLARDPRKPAVAVLETQGARVVQGDVRDLRAVGPEAVGAELDIVLHLAASLDLRGGEGASVNVEGTREVLRWAREHGARYVVYASSVEAQGPASADEGLLTEEHPCRPGSPYAESKLAGERLVQELAERAALPCLLARIGHTYGPGGLGFVTPFLRALLVDDDPLAGVLPAVADRFFQPIFIADLVEAVVRALGSELRGTYNFGGEPPATLREWFTSLAEVLGAGDLARQRLQRRPVADPGALTHVPDVAYFTMGDGARVHRAYSDAKLRAAIGDYQRYNLHRGWAATMAWYQTVQPLPAPGGAATRSRPAESGPPPPRPDGPFMVWIRDQMRARRLGAHELARRLEMDDRAVSAWFHGSAIPDESTCRKLGFLLGVPSADVLRAAKAC